MSRTVFWLVCGALFACGAALTQTDKTELATEGGEESACIAAHVSEGKVAIDACRAQVRAKWCAQWAARFDAGICE